MLDELQPEYLCLYAGELAPDMAEVAPYLISLHRGDAFTEWLLSEGKGKSWGIFITANVAIQALYRHFRRFLMVQTEDGEKLYFRYYDPQVLRVYLPTCTDEELDQVFGPVQGFACAGESASEFGTYVRGIGI